VVVHTAHFFEHSLRVVAGFSINDSGCSVVPASCTGSSSIFAGNPQDPALASPRPERSFLT
jgi:hypothetical protein